MFFNPVPGCWNAAVFRRYSINPGDWWWVMKLMRHMLRVVGLSMAIVLYSGCAAEKPVYRWKVPLQDTATLQRYREVLVDVRAKDGMRLPHGTQERLSQWITEYFAVEYKGTYIPVTHDEAGAGTLRAEVLITRYDDGIAFAATAFQAPGRMRIDGEVTLSDWQTKKKMAEFEMSQIYDRRSSYGRLTRIDELEPEFAQGVVAGITQRDQ